MGALSLAELRLLLRSKEFLVMTIGVPVVFFLVMSEVFGGLQSGGLDMSAYMMISMAAFGAITAALGVGSRIALERQAGWNRQLRLTPLPGHSYVLAKVSVSLTVVLPVLVLIFGTGALVKGVDLSLARWGSMLLIAWIATLPFAVLGVLVGMGLKPETTQAVSVAAFMGFGMFGGLFVPVSELPAAMAAVAKGLPSYWLAEFIRDVAAGRGLEQIGVAVLAAWALAAGVAVVMLYRRDTGRS